MMIKKSLKPILALGASVALTAGSASAAITMVHTYELGEAGSITAGGVVVDGTGSSNFGSPIAGGPLAQTTGVEAPGSTAYASFAGNRSNYGANLSSLATDNFAVELWVRTSNLAQANNTLFITSGGSRGLKFHVNNGNWASSIDGFAWVGANGGAGQGITANTWTHLAVVRSAGTSTFYIDGAAQGGTTTENIIHGTSGHIGVTSGGGSYYDGDIDSVRIYTFDPNTDDPVAAFNLTPEPSSTALLGLGGLALILRRRK